MSAERGGGATWRAALLLAAEVAAFAVLLFATRFIARAHLIPQTDQECYIGGIATDVLAHGLRFPLVAYAPNAYDNGSLFSGLLAALSFSLFGPSVLSLKLGTHLIAAIGAVAALWLLRGCLDELGLRRRTARWTAIAVLVVAMALAPRAVTLSSMYAIGNHVEGAAIDTVLLALFVHWRRSPPWIVAFWSLVGFALYLNKGTVLVIPVLAVAELLLARRSPWRLAAAAGGFLIGILPEALVTVRAHGLGWQTMASKAARGAQAFPQALLDDLWTLADFRPVLLAVWALAVLAGVAWLVAALRRRTAPAGETTGPAPVSLGLVVGTALLHLVALAVMAQGGLDGYALYGYPLLTVLVATGAAWLCARAAAAAGPRAAAAVGVAAVGLALMLYRPDAAGWGWPALQALHGDRAGAACSWRFAEGFLREYAYGLDRQAASAEAHAVARCRSLSDRAQALDCVGGIGRFLSWRRGATVPGEPPLALRADEWRAYAYLWGTHRRGDAAPCDQFSDPALAADCAAAVGLECLAIADQITRYMTGRGLAAPRCEIAPPPFDGYWAAVRRRLWERSAGDRPHLARARIFDADLRRCQGVLDACYASTEW